MSERVAAAWLLLPEYLAEHVLLSAAAMALGLGLEPRARDRGGTQHRACAGPCSRSPVSCRRYPGLALLALFYPLLLAASTLATRLFGVGFSALGFLPSLLALTLYSMLPVIRNGVTGVVNLDPAVIEAARARRHDGAPAAVARRVAARSADADGGRPDRCGLGDRSRDVVDARGADEPGQLYFRGAADPELGVGAVRVRGRGGARDARRFAARTDRERHCTSQPLARLRQGRWCCWPASPLAAVHARRRRAGDLRDRRQELFRAVHSGGAPGAEGHGAEGGAVGHRSGLGSAIVFEALASGDIDAYVDYSGTIWANVMRRTDVPTRDAILDEMRSWLAREHGIVLLGALGFENAYALAMRRDRASSLGIESIADLAAHASRAPHRRRLGVLRAAGVVCDTRRLWPFVRVATRVRADIHVRSRHQRRGRRDLGVHERWTDCGERPRRARGSARRDPALRRDRAARRQACSGSRCCAER